MIGLEIISEYVHITSQSCRSQVHWDKYSAAGASRSVAAPYLPHIEALAVLANFRGELSVRCMIKCPKKI